MPSQREQGFAYNDTCCFKHDVWTFVKFEIFNNVIGHKLLFFMVSLGAISIEHVSEMK